MADPKVLPDCGGGGENSAAEYSFHDAWFRDYSQTLPLGSWPVPVVPRTQIRIDLAFALYRAASLFIVFHELAHLTSGHVDLLREKYGLVLMPELAPKEPDFIAAKQRIRIMRALEIDADFDAVNRLLKVTKVAPDVFSTCCDEISGTGEYRDHLPVLLQFFAIGIVLLILARAELLREGNVPADQTKSRWLWPWKGSTTPTHPAATSRFVSFFVRVAIMFSAEHDPVIEYIPKFVGYLDYAAGVMGIPGRNPSNDNRNLILTFLEKADREVSSINDFLVREIQPALDKTLARVGGRRF
jgi:hypothetical protein